LPSTGPMSPTSSSPEAGRGSLPPSNQVPQRRWRTLDPGRGSRCPRQRAPLGFIKPERRATATWTEPDRSFGTWPIRSGEASTVPRFRASRRSRRSTMPSGVVPRVDRSSSPPHRDPDTACGVIAIVTIRGQALFRAWDTDDGLVDAQRRPELADQCETSDGDLVLLRGGGWPTPASRCPIHEHFRRQTANE
jgi:hypothetical protein